MDFRWFRGLVLIVIFVTALLCEVATGLVCSYGGLRSFWWFAWVFWRVWWIFAVWESLAGLLRCGFCRFAAGLLWCGVGII